MPRWFTLDLTKCSLNHSSKRSGCHALPVVQSLKEGETKTETFTVQSIDGTPTTVTISVVGTNDGPVANPDTASTNEDTPVTFAVLGNDTDPDGDPLTVTGATVDPAKGTVTVNPDGTLSFTPAANVNGPVTVTYTIADGKGGTTTAIATVNIAPLNDDPLARNDVNGLVKTDSLPATGNVITNPAGIDTDVDGDTLTVTTVAGAPVSGATVITGLFGTLGHGINDVDTAVLMKLQSGAITPASVAGVVKGMNGRPGELRGAFSSSQDLGTLYANTESGVFGMMRTTGCSANDASSTSSVKPATMERISVLLPTLSFTSAMALSATCGLTARKRTSTSPTNESAPTLAWMPYCSASCWQRASLWSDT